MQQQKKFKYFRLISNKKYAYLWRLRRLYNECSAQTLSTTLAFLMQVCRIYACEVYMQDSY